MNQGLSHRFSMLRLLPFIAWIRTYRPVWIKNDVIAGVTVAAVLIPQSMAYAILAGLPPVYGLYAAAAAPMIGALWGSLPQLATGPIAIMSLLVLTSLRPYAEPGTPSFVGMAFLLAFMVGIIYLLVGLFRLGEVMSFISHAAVKGFTAAAALIITATQLPNFLGIQVEGHEYIFPQLVEIIRRMPDLQLPTLAVGAAAFGIIYGIKRLRPAFPASIVALMLTTAATFLFHLDERGVAVIGRIPEGLPRLGLPNFDIQIMSDLIGPAVVIAMVSFAETYSVGKAVSSKTKQPLDVDQEFIGQGLANVAGSFLQSYPVSGSFSRTAINFAAGAKTGLSGVVCGLVVILALLLFTPLFTYIPKTALAALVISAVLLLFHPKEVFRLWRMNRHDGVVALTVFVISLLAKPDYALLIGVTISLILFLWQTMHPRIVRVTKDPRHNMFVNGDVFQLPSCPQILQLRSDNVIYFANAEYTVDHLLQRLEEVKTPVRFLLVDLQAIGFIDLTGIDELKRLIETCLRRKLRVAFMSIHAPVMETFRRSGLVDAVDSDLLIANRGEAIGTLFAKLDHAYCRDFCPYSLFYECAAKK